MEGGAVWRTARSAAIARASVHRGGAPGEGWVDRKEDGAWLPDVFSACIWCRWWRRWPWLGRPAALEEAGQGRLAPPLEADSSRPYPRVRHPAWHRSMGRT